MALFNVKTISELQSMMSRGADPNFQDVRGNTFLHCLVKKNNKILVSELLKYQGISNSSSINVDVNIKDYSNRSPMYYAKDKDMVNILINSGGYNTVDNCEDFKNNSFAESICDNLKLFGYKI